MKEKRSGTPKSNRNNKKKRLMCISHYKDCLSISSFQDATVYMWMIYVSNGFSSSSASGAITLALPKSRPMSELDS